MFFEQKRVVAGTSVNRSLFQFSINDPKRFFARSSDPGGQNCHGSASGYPLAQQGNLLLDRDATTS